MNEPTITIPLSALAGVKELTLEGILKALQSSADIKQIQQQAANAVQAWRVKYQTAAMVLGNILDDDLNPMQRAQKLRELQNSMNEGILP